MDTIIPSNDNVLSTKYINMLAKKGLMPQPKIIELKKKLRRAKNCIYSRKARMKRKNSKQQIKTTPDVEDKQDSKYTQDIDDLEFIDYIISLPDLILVNNIPKLIDFSFLL